MKLLKVFGISAVLIVLIGVVLTVTGWGGQLFFAASLAFNKPAGDFNPIDAAAVPDYSLAINWAALPAQSGPAGLVPKGVEVQPQGEHSIDVFFIHPTGFLTSGSWTSPMDLQSGTEENTHRMMANQASAFNGCCNIYAPRYREANMFSYFGETALRDEVLDFAYQDVKRAFEYYLAQHNQVKPFIIAGHSQGSHHARRLLKEVIDAGDLHKRMVAAYMVGSILIPISPAWFDSLDHITACKTANDLHCVVAWDTMPEGAAALERPEESLCTNPLSWRVNEERAEAGLNDGALVPVGKLNTAIGHQADTSSHQVFELMGEPLREKTWAQCKDGTLYVEQHQGAGFELDDMGTFHGIAYAPFYMNIHNNAKLRSDTFTASADL